MSKSILLLDEDPEVLAFLTVLYEERGVRVLRARSRTEAMEVLGRTFVPVDLILANIVITHLSDTDFEQDVANLREGIPILYMSAFVEDGVYRVEVMKRPYDAPGDWGTENSPPAAPPANEGVVNAVMAALSKKSARAGAN